MSYKYSFELILVEALSYYYYFMRVYHASSIFCVHQLYIRVITQLWSKLYFLRALNTLIFIWTRSSAIIALLLFLRASTAQGALFMRSLSYELYLLRDQTRELYLGVHLLCEPYVLYNSPRELILSSISWCIHRAIFFGLLLFSSHLYFFDLFLNFAWIVHVNLSPIICWLLNSNSWYLMIGLFSFRVHRPRYNSFELVIIELYFCVHIPLHFISAPFFAWNLRELYICVDITLHSHFSSIYACKFTRALHLREYPARFSF